MAATCIDSRMSLCLGLVGMAVSACSGSRSDAVQAEMPYYITTDGQAWEIDLANVRVYFPDWAHDHARLVVSIESRVTCDGSYTDAELSGQTCVLSSSGRHEFSFLVGLTADELQSLMEEGGAFTLEPETHQSRPPRSEQGEGFYDATTFACSPEDCVVDELGRYCYRDSTIVYLSQLNLHPNEDLSWDIRFLGWLSPEAATTGEGEPYVHGRVRLKDCTRCNVQEEWEAWQEHHTCYDYY